MRALRFRNYGKPSVLAVEETAAPWPGPNEVLVEVSAARINRADVAAVAGAFKSTTPRTPGRDFAGVIVEGAGAGQEVWGSGEGMGIGRDGAHAEFVNRCAAGTMRALSSVLAALPARSARSTTHRRSRPQAPACAPR